MLRIIIHLKLVLSGDFDQKNGINEASNILVNRTAVKFSVKITTGAAPFFDMAPHICTFNGCFGFGFNLRG